MDNNSVNSIKNTYQLTAGGKIYESCLYRPFETAK